MESSPLEGIRVVELGGGIPAGYCSHLLAGYGADVVQIGDPGLTEDEDRYLSRGKRRVPMPDADDLHALLTAAHVVVDGRAGFVGSQNMIDSSYHNKKHEAAGRKWRELTTKVQGPVVQSMNLVFASDWFIETKEILRDYVQPEPFPDDLGDLTCQIVPSGPGFPDENNLRLFNTLIYGAQRRLTITSPYFVPDDSLLYAVTTAAQRGVDVELFVSEKGDQFLVHHAQQSYYEALLEAGVRIYLYKAPFVLHAKHFTIDDEVVALTPKEFDLLAFLADDAGAVRPRQELLENVWDPHWYGPTKTLDVHVASLRKKLGDPGWIETVRGVGFRLRALAE